MIPPVSAKGVPDGSIIMDGDVYDVEESPAWVNKIDASRKLLHSKKEAIGKIAGRIILLGEIPKELAFQAQCVLATGVLQRVPIVKNAPFLLFGFDAKTVTLSPSKW